MRALTLGGDLVAARVVRDEAMRSARALGDPALTAQVIVSFDVSTLWSNRRYGTMAADIVELAEQTLLELPPGDGELRARLLVTLALELHGEPGQRGRAAAEAMAEKDLAAVRPKDSLGQITSASACLISRVVLQQRSWRPRLGRSGPCHAMPCP